MLGIALWFALVLALLAVAVLDGAATFARASVHAAADHLAAAALQDAVADYQQRLQAAIAASASQLASPAPFAGTPASLDGYAAALAGLPATVTRTIAPGGDARGTRFTVTYAVTPTTVAPPSCDGSAHAGSDAIARLQCSGFVQESRISLRVDASILDASGVQTYARRETYVALRLFALPPYSAIVGSDDGAADAPAGGDALTAPAHEGDLGGTTPGTSIHVRYECRDGAGHCANAAPPDPDAALRTGASWTDGNQPAP
ncbi:hypothetical protein [Vulcanimicrobium alpinum]|uniref:hypothetical protein n=1 Tax=Vulcanimicrobium alpinum TaxID=3016050 RepID=UPI00295E7CE9|nr:hypothetical protein [Vulcanimicrobium alpinum]